MVDYLLPSIDTESISVREPIGYLVIVDVTWDLHLVGEIQFILIYPVSVPFHIIDGLGFLADFILFHDIVVFIFLYKDTTLF